MKKTNLVMLSAFIIFAAFASASAGGKEQYAVISMERVFDAYHKTKKASARFRSRANEIDIQREAMFSKIQSLKDNLKTLQKEASDSSLSKDKQIEKKQLAEKKYTEFRDAENKLIKFNKSSKKELAHQMQQAQEEIVSDIRKIIGQYVKQKDIIMVFDSSGKSLNAVESIVYFDKALDITDEIIKILNRKAPEGAQRK